MKYKEVKTHYKSGKLEYHYIVDESDYRHGEYRDYHENGQLSSHKFSLSGYRYGEVKAFTDDGTLSYHYLRDGKGNKLATVIEYCKPSTHSGAQLIEIAKEHNLPLLSDIPKTEAERTHWNLKWPDLPYIAGAIMSRR